MGRILLIGMLGVTSIHAYARSIRWYGMLDFTGFESTSESSGGVYKDQYRDPLSCPKSLEVLVKEYLFSAQKPDNGRLIIQMAHSLAMAGLTVVGIIVKN